MDEVEGDKKGKEQANTTIAGSKISADPLMRQEADFFTLKIYHGGVYMKDPIEMYVGGSMETF